VASLALIDGLRRDALAQLPPEVATYVDCGTGTETSVAEAITAWDRYRLRPHVLREVATVDVSTTVLDATLPSPVLVAPTGYHQLVHPAGEVETARGVAAAGGLFIVSNRCMVRLEDVAAAAGGPWWFQVYVMRDRDLTEALVARAVAAGATTLVLTGDTPYGGRKPGGGAPVHGEEHLTNVLPHLTPGSDPVAAIAHDPTVGLEAIAWLHDLSGLPVLVKGVLRADDARACLDAGAAGVIVSNHGGRQLDRSIPTARALPEVAVATAGRGEVLVDGGLRDGTSILSALALGASGVLVGRPVLWALATGGAAAVEGLLRALDDDLRHIMALAGARCVAELEPSLVSGATTDL
jgi:4-hydroxymandelate oxidase